MAYRLRLRRDTALEVLRTMPPTPRKRMRAALGRLADDPSGRSNGLDVRPLHTDGPTTVYRLRVGEWRAGWMLRGECVDVVRIFHRSDGYGWLERLHP